MYIISEVFIKDGGKHCCCMWLLVYVKCGTKKYFLLYWQPNCILGKMKCIFCLIGMSSEFHYLLLRSCQRCTMLVASVNKLVPGNQCCATLATQSVCQIEAFGGSMYWTNLPKHLETAPKIFRIHNGAQRS